MHAAFLHSQDPTGHYLHLPAHGKGRFEYVADRLPRSAIELDQPQLLDRPEILA